MGILNEDFSMPPEQLDASEKRYGVYGIYDMLTPEQLGKIVDGTIFAKYLTLSQLQIAKQIENEDDMFQSFPQNIQKQVEVILS